jgi:hypothetical protein
MTIPSSCPVCKNSNLTLIRRPFSNSPGELLGYRCENGHFVMSSRNESAEENSVNKDAA